MTEHDDPALGALLQAKASYYTAPPVLREQIETALALADAPSASRRRPLYQWLGMAASFACGVLASVLLMHFSTAQRSGGRLMDEVVAAHVRSLMADHLADVASTDQHTVKPWFAGKLDFSPPVQDLADRGYALSGGRLDYFDGHPVAALVYQHRKHVINVFVWPSREAAQEEMAAGTYDGFNVTAWQAAGMRFSAVSDLNAQELEMFSRLFRRQGGAPGQQNP